MNPICWLTRRRLDAYHDGELAPGARGRLEGHLGRCRGCAGESAAIRRLQTALMADAPELPGSVWDAFWPQVRTRLQAPLVSEPFWRRAWAGAVAPRRLAFGSALAAAALAVVAVLAPWQGLERHPSPAVVASAPTVGGAIQQVVVQSVEAADPQSSVMVYTNPESDMTVVWVFGLERTDI